nr:reverse transcriptase domain-containing protein [Tanacetum cinerariifolium]
MPRECLKFIKSKSKVRQTRAKAVVAKVSTSSSTQAVLSKVSELKDLVRALLLDKKTNPQLQLHLLLLLQLKQLSQTVLLAVVLTHTKIVPLPAKMFIETTSKRTLPSNTITNPKEDLKGITARSGAAYQGPTISTPSKVVKQGTEGDNKLPVIIAKEFGDEDKSALIKVLKSHKRAIAWKLSDIQGINPKFYTHKILVEEDYKPAVQHQRRVNPKIYDVIKKEVEKLLDTGLIYPISDSPWVSPVHCVPKKGGFTVIENEENELILTRLVTRWRVCIDYQKLNEATSKDNFPLPFMDQMLERLAGNEYYCFLDGFSG